MKPLFPLGALLSVVFLFACGDSSPIAPTPTPTPTPVPVAVETLYTVSGRVVSGTSTTGVPGAVIIVVGDRNNGKTTMSDADGHYIFQGLVFEGFSIIVDAPGYIRNVFSVILTAGVTTRTFNPSVLPNVFVPPGGSNDASR